MEAPSCRFCSAPLKYTFADLGVSPLSNSFVAPERAQRMEPFFPLHAYVCSQCRLVQLEAFQSPEEIFGDYLYFSSFSDSWLKHASGYADLMTRRFGLGAQSLVVEVASNDGYLLQYFRERDIPVLGIEPAANVAKVAIEKGVPTKVMFFGTQSARKLREQGVRPDIIAANNVLAHVPDINDFVGGFATLISDDGVITVEFPHLLRQIAENQFDTIYHEHFSYLSLNVVHRVFEHHGMKVFDVEELPTHGGSLRVYACLRASQHKRTAAVDELLQREVSAGLEGDEVYARFSSQVVETKLSLLEFLISAKRAGKKVVGYGAPAKGNTLLNYCGVGPELLEFTVDRSPHKQGMLLPGTRVPVRAPDAILEARPDYVLILPWNLRDEIMSQMKAVREWGGKFVVPIPKLQVIE
ncbi:MAG: C-methyltransferase [Xanthobacteraceae bacterium]|nr:MAG: C-methyltransferase [Xanthobacteraceae bacterium]